MLLALTLQMFQDEARHEMSCSLSNWTLLFGNTHSHSMSPRLEEYDRKQLELEAYSIPPQIVEELII